MKYLLALILICYTVDANCQIDRPIKKGNIVLGGGAGFTYSNSYGSYKVFDPDNGQYYYQNSDQESVSFSFGPLFGYFIIDGLEIGISHSYSYNQQKYSNYKGITNSIGIDPFIKYYFNNGFFTGLESGYNYSISKQQGFDYRRKYSYLSINPSIGYAIFINSKVSIEPSLEYSFTKVIDKDDSSIDSNSKTNKFFFTIGFHLFL
jgi:hypothetical protein